MVALSNPKGCLFFSALLLAFIDPTRALWPEYLSATALFVGLDAATMLGYAALASGRRAPDGRDHRRCTNSTG